MGFFELFTRSHCVEGGVALFCATQVLGLMFSEQELFPSEAMS